MCSTPISQNGRPGQFVFPILFSYMKVPEVVVSAVSNECQPAGDFVMNENLSGSSSTRMSESTPNKLNVASYYNDGAEEEAKQPAQASSIQRENRSKSKYSCGLLNIV